MIPGSSAYRGWHSRGYLPHFDKPRLIQSVSFRLHDAVPTSVITAWKQEFGWHQATRADDPVATALRERIARYEDTGRGACWLGRARIARLVEAAVLHFDAKRYRLLAWCVMPNHVHVLIETGERYSLAELVHAWKSFTAKEANKFLGRKGPFWMPDYYDRFMRDAHHLAVEVAYIENNPVKAGLVKNAAEWPFSSASRSPGTAGVPPARMP